ncbi:MAG TPA: type IV toxin-antitoxin system AbiEi family antitoxin domain-containing protein [Micromonospora sp.]
MMTSSRDRSSRLRIEETAGGQQQIITRAQLVECGVTDIYISRQIRRGWWQRVLPATYALVTGALSDEQRRVSASLYVGRGAQITGLSALAWYGFRYAPPSDRVRLIIPHGTRRGSAGHVVVARALSLDDNARDAGLYQLCSPARAVVDAGRELHDLRTVRAVLAEAVQRGFTNLDALDEEVKRAKRSRTALVRRAFTESVDGVRSAPEAELRQCLSVSRVLPEIRWNPRLSGPDGVVLPTPDGYLEDAAIALEVDSREYHFTPTGWARTIDRHNELSRYGVLILHFTPARIRRDPAGVRQIVEDAYRSRRGSGATCGVFVGAPSYTQSV